MIYVITGPTCTGKSEDAHTLAKAINAEIVNGDAFQIYKELNIGVAKPNKDFLDVPHHLFDFVSPDTPYSIMEYQQDARRVIDDIHSRGKNVVIVGGSGLYIRSALYDYEFTKKESEVDMSEYENLTNEELFEKLREIDPEECKILHPNNRKRVMRAIEIYLQNGKAKSEINASQEHKPIYDVKFLVKGMDREVLYDRINKRVDKMVKLGLVDEVKMLVNKYGQDKQSLQAIGYKEIIASLNGEYSISEAIDLIKKNTRNYAKRQLTFIRHQFDVEYYVDINNVIMSL